MQATAWIIYSNSGMHFSHRTLKCLEHNLQDEKHRFIRSNAVYLGFGQSPANRFCIRLDALLHLKIKANADIAMLDEGSMISRPAKSTAILDAG